MVAAPDTEHHYEIRALLPADGWYLLRSFTERDSGEGLTDREPVGAFALVVEYEDNGDEMEPRVEALVPGDCGSALWPASLVRSFTDARRQRLWRAGQSTCYCWELPRVPRVDASDPGWCARCAAETRSEEWSG